LVLLIEIRSSFFIGVIGNRRVRCDRMDGSCAMATTPFYTFLIV